MKHELQDSDTIFWMGINFFVFLMLSASLASAEDAVRSVGVRSGFGRLDSSLSGSGFNGDLPSHASLMMGADFSYRPAAGRTSYEIRYDKTSADLTTPAGLTPAVLSVFREDIALLAFFSPWENLANVQLKAGLGFSTMGGTATLPNEILTTQETRQVLIGGTHVRELSPQFSLASEFTLSLPFALKESDQVTGYNPNALGFEGRVALRCLFDESVIGFIGFAYRYDRVVYEGSVNRGVTGATDVRTLTSVPFGIAVRF